jgi:hypothetical protein
MAIVPRYFEPSVRDGRPKAREAGKRDPWAKLMIGGGREGPEVGRKPPRTSRVTEATIGTGSNTWSAELEEGKTKPDARTQPPFLRDTRLMELAYRQGIMSVSDALRVAQDAADYAKKDPSYIPKVEYTSVAIRGGLASATGRLIDPDVDTLSQELSADWAADLAQLAADIRAVEARVPRTPKSGAVGVRAFEFVGRVYLNLARVSIPVEQFAVLPSGTKGGKADVYGVYSPSPEDGPVMFKGAELKPGQAVRFPASAVQFVTVDPPEYRQSEFIDSPAFARARGILIEPELAVAGRLGLAPGEPYIVPYSQILRLRMIYPPAKGYERKSSRAIESTASIERDMRAAQKRINTISDALVLQVRALAGRMQPGSSFDIGATYELTRRGAKLTKVTRGGPAQQAGLKVGDIIRSVGGRPLSMLDADDVESVLRRPLGTTVTVDFQRDGKEESLDVVWSRVPLEKLIYIDPATQFAFRLEDPTFAGTVRPVVVWVAKGDVYPAGDPGLVGRPVTPIDFLRALRTLASGAAQKGLKDLRKS